jgi:hypothetical protein
MNDPITQDYPCLYCLQVDSAHLRFDKNGRPYVVCDACGTRSFMKNMRCLRGVALMMHSARDILERCAQSPEVRADAERVIVDFIDAVKARRAGTMRETSSPTEGTHVQSVEAAVASR